MCVENARTRHRATANGWHGLIFDTSACPSQVVTKHGWFRGKTGQSVIPVHVRGAFIADSIVVFFVSAFLREIRETAARIRKESSKGAKDGLGGETFGP